MNQRFQTHLKQLKLKGLQPKTIDAYASTVRRMGTYFDRQIANLSPARLQILAYSEDSNLKGKKLPHAYVKHGLSVA